MRRFTLTWKFTLFSLAAFFLTGTILALSLSYYIKNNMMQNAFDINVLREFHSSIKAT